MSDHNDPVRLRPVRENDLPLFDRFLTDPDALGEFQWQGWRDPNTFRRRWAENGMLGEDGGQLMVVSGGEACDEESLGCVAWRKVVIFRTSYCWNIGIQLLPEARGRGAGTRAQRLLVQYLFAHSPVIRVEATTESGNIAERRSLERAGFSQEGVSRSVVFRDGQWRDGVRYAVLRGDVGWRGGEEPQAGAGL
ncbi:GNAT family N-acetyltransferase [Streptomyces sp. NPDC057302]|uniref:GNAT family N-acetyltransferase n=1 Tax=Streptomyces sp. NPDC057302 TaxID=3346094 RepID=UPI003625CA96